MNRARVYHRWAPYVDADPVREHIHQLRRAGIGIEQIAALADLSPSHIRGLIYTSHNGKPPFQRVRPDTAAALLAIGAVEGNRAASSRIDATGTRRRLQALTATGWTVRWLATELHRSPRSVRRTMTAHTVTVRTARLIDELYQRLWNTPPPHDTHAARTASAAARAGATCRGWHPPLAWDDIDHDTDAPMQSTQHHDTVIDEIAIERATTGDSTVCLTHTELLEAVHRLSQQGKSIRTIAQLLAISERTVSRHRKKTVAA